MTRNTTLKGLVATLVIGVAMALPTLASAQGHGRSHGSHGGITIQFGSRSNNHGYSNRNQGYYGGHSNYGYNSHRAQERHAYRDHRAAEDHAFRDHQHEDRYYGASRRHMARERHAYRDHRAAESHAYRDHRGGGH